MTQKLAASLTQGKERQLNQVMGRRCKRERTDMGKAKGERTIVVMRRVAS